MNRKHALPLMLLLLAGCENHRTYGEGCDAPPKGWISPRQGRGVLSLLSVITVRGDDLIDWNGKQVSEPVLGDYLKQTKGLNPVPVTQIRFGSSVDCETVRRLRALMSGGLDCTGGRCAEGAGKWWEIGDVVWHGHPSEPYDPDAPAPPKDK